MVRHDLGVAAATSVGLPFTVSLRIIVLLSALHMNQKELERETEMLSPLSSAQSASSCVSCVLMAIVYVELVVLPSIANQISSQGKIK